MEKKSGRFELRLLLYYVIALVVLYLVLLGHEVVRKATFVGQDSFTNWVIAGATSAGVIVSGAGIYWLRSTLITNQEMVRVSRDALEDQIWLRRIERRPKLVIGPVTLSQWLSDDKLSVKLEVTNKGEHRAHNIQFSASIHDAHEYRIAMALTSNETRDAFTISALRKYSNSSVLSIDANSVFAVFDRPYFNTSGDEKYLFGVIIYSYQYSMNQSEVFSTSFYLPFSLSELKEKEEHVLGIGTIKMPPSKEYTVPVHSISEG